MAIRVVRSPKHAHYGSCDECTMFQRTTDEAAEVRPAVFRVTVSSCSVALGLCEEHAAVLKKQVFVLVKAVVEEQQVSPVVKVFALGSVLCVGIAMVTLVGWFLVECWLLLGRLILELGV